MNVTGRLFLQVLAIVLLAANSTPTGIHNLSPTDRLHLLEVDQFTPIRLVAAIPTPVRVAFAKGVDTAAFEMADPGEGYQEGCVIMEGGLPWRRLIFAAISADHFVMHYEMGGRGHSYHIVVFKVSEQEAFLTWRAISRTAMGALDALRANIKENRLDDFAGYSW